MTLYEKTVKGTLFGSGNPMHDIRNLIGLYQAGKLKLDELVTNRTRSTTSARASRTCSTARTSEAWSSTSTERLAQLLARVDERIVGLRREAEVLAATLAGGCHVVLEGPPGTGKSTLLRAVADGAGLGVEFVEGNAELTPARLVGHHDPALVLEAGYTPDTFVDGPLITALREGRLLYIEELNRVPEETLNVLVGALAEGEIHVPRLGRVPAEPSFRLIAAMNPFDAVGTARVSQAIADRMCRIAITYQDAPGERAIVERGTGRRGPLVGARGGAHAAHARAPEGADGRLGARRDRPRAARPRARRAARRGRAGSRATPRSPTPRSPRCPAGCGSRRAASARRRRSCSS